jgi:hypothetical protein
MAKCLQAKKAIPNRKIHLRHKLHLKLIAERAFLMSIPHEIKNLIDRFNENQASYSASGYNEMQLRQEFLYQLFPMHLPFLILLFALCGISMSQQQNSSSNVLIGIMEDNREELVNWKKGPSKTRVILPLFEKKGNEWVLSKSAPKRIHWTIAFDGRNSGNFISRPNPGKYFPDVNAHVPESNIDPNLTFGQPSENFSGWENTLFNRPLVLVSNGKFDDPEKWKVYKPSEIQINLFKSGFQIDYPKVLNCDKNEEPLPNPFLVDISDIKIISCYHSNQGFSLVSMFLEGGKCGINDGPFLNQLFLFPPNKNDPHINLSKRIQPSTTSINNQQFSLILVDAGDYDADGKLELVFFVSGYNEDGYALFYDSFQKSVMYTWHYH